MKTYILRCETFDTRASLEDRLKWVTAGRVLLVMPEVQPPILTRQDLIRIRRRGSDLHAQLGLVTKDALLLENARSAGLEVFRSKDEARQAEWRVEVPGRLRRHPDLAALSSKTRQEKQSELPTWLRRLVFGLAVLAILVLILVLLPGAAVELNLPGEEQTLELVAPAGVNQSSPDLIAGIPLYRAFGEVQARIEQKTSGSISVGDQPARGVVIVTNLTAKALLIPAGTVVRSLGKNPQRFGVEQTGNLPAGPGTSISLPVREMNGSGTLGNQPAGAIVAMDPPLGLSVSVNNPNALSGGTQKTSPALAQVDLLAGEAKLEEALIQAFIERESGSLPDDAILIRESIKVDFIRAFDPPPPYDQPLTSFELDSEAELTGYYYLESELVEWVITAMDASLATGRLSMPGMPQVEAISIDYQDETEAYLSIRATRQTIPSFDPQAIAVQLRGMQIQDAITLIRDSLVPGSQPVITLNPRWWFRLPLIPERIHIDG